MLGVGECEQRAVRREAVRADPDELRAAAELDRFSRAHRRVHGKPVPVEIAAVIVPFAWESPSFQPAGTPGKSGRVSPPENGWESQAPDSSPVSSCHHVTDAPASAACASTTPTGWSVTRRCAPVARSRTCACQIPLSVLS